MRVIVCGSRSWTDRGRIQERLAQLPRGAVVVHGCARGADRLAGDAAHTLGLTVEEHPAHWSQGRFAGIVRNEKMADLGADLCIAFWDGLSTGTKHMVDTAWDRGIEVELQL